MCMYVLHIYVCMYVFVCVCVCVIVCVCMYVYIYIDRYRYRYIKKDRALITYLIMGRERVYILASKASKTSSKIVVKRVKMKNIIQRPQALSHFRAAYTSNLRSQALVA